MIPKGSGTQQQPTQHDGLKWTVVFFIIAVSVVANFYFSAIPWAVRAAIGLLAAVALIFVAMQTRKGQNAASFIKGAKMELRKVSWPTRKETVQMTFVVVIVVIVTALLLWGFDSLFMWAIAWLTGQRG